MPRKARKTARSALPASDARAQVLASLRSRKMARSIHTFTRGSAERFYAWLAEHRSGAVPEGPAVWIGGDCHLGNLGPVADKTGEVAVQIRDLDQSVIGNPAHDLLRLGFSVATAARSSDLPGIITWRMIEALIAGYEQAFDPRRRNDGEGDARPAAVKIAMKAALHRSWRKLDRQTIRDAAPRIPLGKRFWPLSDDERAAIHALFESASVSPIGAALSPTARSNAKMKVLDAAYWVKGCSSLGRRRFAVMLDIDDGCADGHPPCLIDIKEAAAAKAPMHRGAQMPRDAAQRVVEGARHLSPMLGSRMCAARLDGHSVVIRELMPQDLKLEAERLSEDDAIAAARYLARVIGRAHAAQMDGATQRAWRAALRSQHAKTVDAPSWLWRSIIELMATHEEAYLEHCRRYVLGTTLG
ncbi:hypothetical protein IST455A_04060 [Burkholderia multivorans]|uniref:DUF2252 family protein n=1 Tax=Burkholderia multivorans TaxID=87883 RepID=UPI0006A5B185|nr:DUF2252 family protein [Burkholderia multivorans]KOE23734.1 hypothetical protein AI46_22435 [Burkholderia multivorans R-20526]MBU9243744.1 DUF2252 domain-containing protein [Burkholderia multivorans]MBU9332033.1 DUF2252 domain-containing protein [Burkholderia multivorans]MBU9367712.1 DUF2252 domain-containing protein [Burkholderia multivorans]MBU9410197.1 DUF2252 domain-containing protein [Burkholderia multivorans]